MNKETKIFINPLNKDFSLLKDEEAIAYFVEDTINLNKNRYSISELNYDNNEIYLTKIKANDGSFTGLNNGAIFKNYKLTLVDGSIKSIDDLLKQNNYLIIDFWGTWCEPCIKSIPKLKQLKEQNTSVEILGVSYDKDLNKVKDFIRKHNMEYPNYFISQNPDLTTNENLIDRLKINSFPTYILIDKNRKIRYRGSSQTTLDSISKIVRN
jgi:thiol-disulfide isomerase/thioredoxin